MLKAWSQTVGWVTAMTSLFILFPYSSSSPVGFVTINSPWFYVNALLSRSSSHYYTLTLESVLLCCRNSFVAARLEESTSSLTACLISWVLSVLQVPCCSLTSHLSCLVFSCWKWKPKTRGPRFLLVSFYLCFLNKVRAELVVAVNQSSVWVSLGWLHTHCISSKTT